MCFLYNGKLTQELKEKVKDQELIEMYKIFDVDSDYGLISPYCYNIVKKGLNIDQQCIDYDYKNRDRVEKCFHCFDSKEIVDEVFQLLKEDSVWLFENDFVVKIYVKPEDIIAKGPLYHFNPICDGKYNSVGVKAFIIKDEDYDSIIKEYNEKCQRD